MRCRQIKYTHREVFQSDFNLVKHYYKLKAFRMARLRINPLSPACVDGALTTTIEKAGKYTVSKLAALI